MDGMRWLGMDWDEGRIRVVHMVLTGNLKEKISI